MKYFSVAASLLVLPYLLAETAPEVQIQLAQKERILFGDSPTERNVDRFKCTVDEKGWFGTVGSGNYAEVHYGFGIEAAPTVDLERALKAAQMAVQENLLSEAFPTVCGHTRRNMRSNRVLGQIVGYKFEEDKMQTHSTCGQFGAHRNTVCAIYMGTILSYGVDSTDILTIIEGHIASAEASILHPDIQRIFFMELDGYQLVPDTEENLALTEPANTDNGDGSLSPAILTLGIVLSAWSLVMAILGIVWIRKTRDSSENSPLRSKDLNVNVLASSRSCTSHLDRHQERVMICFDDEY